ncbi:MAG TPA: hypothetical protein VGN37_02280 [Actinocatenispora sp.]
MNHLILDRCGLDLAPYQRWLDRPSDRLFLFAKEGRVDRASLSGSSRVVLTEFDDLDRAPELEHRAWTLAQEQGVDTVVALSEYDLLPAARLRELLGVPGQGTASALAFRDKARMKELLDAAGVPVAGFGVVDHAADLIGFASRAGYPVVVKPRYGSGSVGVEVLTDEADLVSFLRRNPELADDRGAGLLAEEYVEHELFHVDGLLHDGRVELAWPSRMTSCLGFHHGAALRSRMLAPDEPGTAELLALTDRVVAALPAPGSAAFHLEVFGNEKRGLVANEIACRVGGARILPAVEAAFGLNLLEAHARAVAGYPVTPPRDRRPRPLIGFVMFPPVEGTVRAVPSGPPPDAVVDYRLKISPGDVLGAAHTSVDNVASVLVRGDTADELDRALDSVVSWFHGSTRIEPAAGSAAQPC